MYLHERVEGFIRAFNFFRFAKFEVHNVAFIYVAFMRGGGLVQLWFATVDPEYDRDQHHKIKTGLTVLCHSYL